MRESVGTTWTFSLVITFTLIFAAFLSLALTYSKAYKIKNEIVTIIEKYEGLTIDVKNNKNAISEGGSLSIINTYLRNSGYSAMGRCEIDKYNTNQKVFGINDISNNSPGWTPAIEGEKYYYCVTYENTSINNKCSGAFNVRVFYDFNLPVLGQIRQFSIAGHTNEMYHPVVFGKDQCKNK